MKILSILLSLKKKLSLLLIVLHLIIWFVFVMYNVNHLDMLNLENFFKSLPSIEEIGEILSELFDNKLYSNINGNEIPEITNISGVNGESSTSTSEESNAANNQGETANDQSETANDQSETANNQDSAPTDDYELSSDTVSSDDNFTCRHVTDPDWPACECNHPHAYYDARINHRDDRCHVCSEPHAGLSCDECWCLFHAQCLPDSSNIHPDSDYQNEHSSDYDEDSEEEE